MKFTVLTTFRWHQARSQRWASIAAVLCRTLSSPQTGTLCALNTNSPCPSPSPWYPPSYFLSYEFDYSKYLL